MTRMSRKKWQKLYGDLPTSSARHGWQLVQRCAKVISARGGRLCTLRHAHRGACAIDPAPGHFVSGLHCLLIPVAEVGP